MSGRTNEYLHPALRPTAPTKLRNPAQHAYQRLVEAIATESPKDGFHDVAQLPALTNAQRAVILRACPDALNDIELTAEGLADVFDGNVEPGLYLWAQVEPLIRRWLLLDVVAECEAEREVLAVQRYDEPETVADGALS